MSVAGLALALPVVLLYVVLLADLLARALLLIGPPNNCGRTCGPPRSPAPAWPWQGRGGGSGQ